MNINNLNVFRNPAIKTRVCALSIASVLATTTLAGCAPTSYQSTGVTAESYFSNDEKRMSYAKEHYVSNKNGGEVAAWALTVVIKNDDFKICYARIERNAFNNQAIYYDFNSWDKVCTLEELDNYTNFSLIDALAWGAEDMYNNSVSNYITYDQALEYVKDYWKNRTTDLEDEAPTLSLK